MLVLVFIVNDLIKVNKTDVQTLDLYIQAHYSEKLVFLKRGPVVLLNSHQLIYRRNSFYGMQSVALLDICYISI